MKTCLDCLPCFVRQTLDASRQVSDDPAFHEKTVRGLFRDLAEADWNESPPVIAQRIHRKLREQTGIADPYIEQKRAHNKLALHLLPALRRDVEQSDDPLISAAHFAIAGNIIDLGAKSGLDERDVLHAIEHATEEPLEGDLDAFRNAAREATSILYLADNAGEIIFDRLLIEQLGPERITLAVRGAPILNDATLEDAIHAGYERVPLKRSERGPAHAGQRPQGVAIIGNGSDVPGTDLEQCSDEFRAAFKTADLIISKGQGNFETLSENPRRIFFLFKVKCPVVAAASGKPLGAHVLMEKPAQ
jgi:uncharacterized protein with ATP-grasp and redox domains